MKMKFIAEIDKHQESYEFHLLRVVSSEDGRLFYGEDSGCSCPTPFEGFHSEANYTPITRGASWDSFKTHVKSWAADGKALSAKDIESFIEKIRILLPGNQ